MTSPITILSPSAERRPRRTIGDVAVAAEAAALLLTARVAVAVLPFAVIGPVLGARTTGGATVSRAASAGPAVARCCWAVAAARRRMPAVSTCLADAIAGQMMLRRRRVPATVVFGPHDRAVPVASGRRAAEALGAPMTIIPGAGHLSQIPHPGAVAAVIGRAAE